MWGFKGSVSDVEDEKSEGVLGVEFQKYSLRGYIRTPALVLFFLKRLVGPYLWVGLPSMAPSCGLRGYRSVVPKKVRRSAHFIVVIDRPGALEHWKDTRYSWVEFHLGDVFMLDVAKMKTVDDYKRSLGSKKQRKSFRRRLQSFNDPSVIHYELVPVEPDDTELVDSLWPLYEQTGQRQGFVMRSKQEFADHFKVPNLRVMLVKDVRDPASPKLVSFGTSLVWKDILVLVWCGTDYSNDVHRTHSTYYNMFYKHVAMAIADPGINQVDAGPCARTVKMSLGFQPVPFSGYVRCKGPLMRAVVERRLKRYAPEQVMWDM